MSPHLPHPHPHPKGSSSNESSSLESSSVESSSCESSSVESSSSESSSCESSSSHDCHKDNGCNKCNKCNKCHDCNKCHNNHKCHCKDDKDCGCVCDILDHFTGMNVIITTKTGNTIIGELIKVTKDCCVKIIEPEVRTPFIPKRLTVIDCKSIESFSVEIMN